MDTKSHTAAEFRASMDGAHVPADSSWRSRETVLSSCHGQTEEEEEEDERGGGRGGGLRLG